MRHRTAIAIVCFGIPLASCATPPNIHAASSYSAPPAPPVKHAFYDPYMPYGEANAIWTPPVIDRDGNIQKPSDPSTQSNRADYEHAPWATGAQGGSRFAPPGTF